MKHDAKAFISDALEAAEGIERRLSGAALDDYVGGAGGGEGLT